MQSSKKRLLILLILGLVAISVALAYRYRRAILNTFPALREVPVVQKLANKKTVAEAMEQYGRAAQDRLRNKFEHAGVSYPPKELVMLGLKAEEELQIYASDDKNTLKYICTFPILGNSGVLGPKLKMGDSQMPEGLYRISELQPNTPYHLALRVNYPNEFDQEMGKNDKRTNLGGDIMIHGNTGSIGCLAMGDPASEEIFALVHDVGLEHTQLIMSPFDFRNPPENIKLPAEPKWLSKLYPQIAQRVNELVKPEAKSNN